MIIRNEYVTLDGVENGIAVQAISKDGKKKFITFKENIRLFKNLKNAETTCRDILDGSKCKYYIILGGKRIPIDKCIKYENSYQYIYFPLAEENENVFPIRYIISEVKEYKTTLIGYLVFENGDTVRCDKKYGIKRQKELIRTVTDIVGDILCRDRTIDKIDKRGSHELVLHIKNKTGKIHIVSNPKLMDINQERKNNGNRVIPFLKEMDKFVTFCIFCTKDAFEPLRINSEEDMISVVQTIIDDLNNAIPETKPHFVEVDYSGYINIMED